jgi:pilus assembly protein CpaC
LRSLRRRPGGAARPRSGVVRRLATAAARCAAVALTAALAAGAASLPAARAAAAQTAERDIIRIDLPVGRAYPIRTPLVVSRLSVAVPEVADVAAIGPRDVVINALRTGETDVLVYTEDGALQHFRVLVHSPADRMQIALQIRFAEVRRDALRELGASARYRDGGTRVGTGRFRDDAGFQDDGRLLVQQPIGYLTVLTDFGTDRLLAFLEAQEQKGNARILAEPTIIAANKDTANFLAGGELPIPVAQGGGAGDLGTRVTIEYREFGVRLSFVGEIISDSLIKLAVRPEVSSLDFTNAVTLSGFRIPAFRTRRVESTIDVRRDQSFIISGMFNEERERVRTGVPLLMDVPILGELFSSTRFQRNESELLVVVTPVIIDPMRPRARDVIEFAPDTTLPARDAIEHRLPRPAAPPPRPPR